MWHSRWPRQRTQGSCRHPRKQDSSSPDRTTPRQRAQSSPAHQRTPAHQEGLQCTQQACLQAHPSPPFACRSACISLPGCPQLRAAVHRLPTSQGATFTPLLPRGCRAPSGATAGSVLCMGKEGREACRHAQSGEGPVRVAARAVQLRSEQERWREGHKGGPACLLCNVAQQHVLAHQLAVGRRTAEQRGSSSQVLQRHDPSASPCS